MKRFLNLFVVIALVFTMTGCTGDNKKNERTALEVLNDTLNNKNEVSNVKMDAVMDMKINTQGMSVDTNIILSGSVVKENDNYKALIELSDNPLIGELKAYLDINNTNLKVYFPSTIYDLIFGIESDDTKWIKLEDKFNIDDEKTDVSSYNVNDYLTENDFYLVSRENNNGTYCLVISNDLLKKFTNDTEYEDDDLKNNYKINIVIDEVNNRIVNVNMDLVELFNCLDLDSEDIAEFKDMIEKFVLNLNVVYGGINVSIPDDVVSSAITSDEYIESIY